MSMEREIKGNCPNCGKEVTVTVWQSLNTEISPEAAQELREGRLMHPACPHCGERLSTEGPMLYHDVEHRVMVWFEPGCPRDLLLKIPADRRPSGEHFDWMMKVLPDYRFEAVSDYGALCECAQILYAGMDERAVAIMKAVILARYSEAHQGRADMDIVFEACEATGERSFFLTDGDDILPQPFDEALYADCLALVGDVKPAVADIAWGAEHLKQLKAKSS